MSILEITDRKTELKEALHRKIEEIYVHTPEERATVEQSLRELDAGLGISLEDVVREIHRDILDCRNHSRT